MFRISRSPWLICVVTLLVSAAMAMAQTAQGRITGTVSDPDGAVIPGVEVIATNDGTGVQTKTQSNEVGLYVLPFLLSGQYTISASSAGFKGYERTGIVVQTSQVMELNIFMELGAVTETVTITAEAPLLQTSDSTVGQFINQRNVEDMPLANRRALELVKLSSNVVFVNYGGEAKPRFAVAGGRSYKSTYMLDGGNIQNIRMASAQVDIDPPVEVIKEFRVVQNGYAAEYGGSASGVLISTTKAGSNDIHGSAFEYFRNDKLDAAYYFAPTEGTRKVKAPLRYNLFGGTVGGPIIKNKTHYFVGYEATRKGLGGTEINTVPSALQRVGDFSETYDKKGNLIPIYDPFSTQGKVRTPFPGNVIPSDKVDPVALGLAKYWPEASRPATNLAGAQNFAANRQRKFTRDNLTARVDHALSDSNRLFGRFVFNKDPYSWTTNHPFGGVGDDQYPISPERDQKTMMFKDTHTMSPNLIMDVAYSFSDRKWYANSAGLGSGVVAEIGLPGVSNDAFPQLRGTGMTNLGRSSERFQKPIRQHQITNSWTWVKSNHVIKFGGEIRKGVNVDINRPVISGQYNFSTTGTRDPTTRKGGFQFASLMTGWVNAFSLRETELLDRYSWYLAWYVQDDWKITPNLTLNLGVRWETDTPVTDRNDRTSSFDRNQINPVSGTPGVVKFAGLNGWDRRPYRTDWNNFGPRFGFAWKPGGSGKWVIRGGYGLFYEMPSTSANQATLGFEISGAASSPNAGITPAFLFQDGPSVDTSKPPLDDSFGAVPVGSKAKTNVVFYEQNRRTGYASHINLGVQRQLPGNTVLEIFYTGNLSRKLPIGTMNINQVRPEIMGPDTSGQAFRPFPQFLNVQVRSTSIGSNNYHAGSIRVEKRLSQGLAFLSGYTWSRSIGDASNATTSEFGNNQIWQDVYNRRLDRGPDALDVIHRATFSSTYNLPWGQGRRWLTDGILSKIIGGWNVGAIMILQGGGPFTVTMQTSTLDGVYAAGAQRADVLRNPNLSSGQQSIQRWFDTEAFAAPAPYMFGNAGRGIIRGDGGVGIDLSISKNFSFGEGRYVQFRADAFNAPNHPDFNRPNSTLGNSGYGIISGATPARTVQLGMRINF